MTDFNHYYQQWQNLATNYPTKALLTVAQKTFKKQTERLNRQKLALEGELWQRAHDKERN